MIFTKLNQVSKCHQLFFRRASESPGSSATSGGSRSRGIDYKLADQCSAVLIKLENAVDLTLLADLYNAKILALNPDTMIDRLSFIFNYLKTTGRKCRTFYR